MSTAAGNLGARAVANRPLLAGVALLLAAVVLLALLGWLAPVKALLCGWLTAFAIANSVSIGSMTWLLIHRLTGGSWGIAAAPVLRPAAAAAPLVLIAFIPVLAGLTQIYPWMADPSATAADVAHWYLNGLSFSIRGLIALAGWSCLALVFATGAGSQLLAGVGLAFFGLTISLVSVDWYLSLEPHYIATAFAAMIAIQQLLTALAVAALVSPAIVDGKVAEDIGALLIATLLGVVYLGFMTFVVVWYGDLPDKAKWFLERGSAGWICILVAALVIGALLPFGMLMIKAVRGSRRGLRAASVLILFGVVLHMLWVMVPAFEDQATIIVAAGASLAVLAVVSLLVGPALAGLLEAHDGD